MAKTNGLKNESIVISKTTKNEDPSQNSYFKTELVRIANLPKIITTNNYSLINWNDGIRKSSNFKSAHGFTVDIDEGLTIDEANERLLYLNLNHIIIPSKRHTAEKHRYHVLLFFSHPVYSSRTYEVIGKTIVKDLLPESDPSVTDSGRFIFGSPEGTEAITYLTGENYNVLDFDHLWTSITEIQSEKNGAITIDDLNGHTISHCLFHDDSNASAFVDYSQESENWYMSCSKCDHTFWMEKDTAGFDSVFEFFWSYKRDVYEMGILNSELYFNPIGIPAFHALTNTDADPKTKRRAYSQLVKSKHISHISRIDYIGDAYTKGDDYEVDTINGIITMRYAPILSKIEDNVFIENYLQDRFGEYMQFIKEYFAVYSYTNYQKLPTLVLKGPRGNGKSTFAELVGSIYEPLSTDWTGAEGDFSYEVEKKFLIVEENATSNKSQYKTLKKYMGQTYAHVKKKFKDPYKILNNMAIAVLSNEAIPMFVDKAELPTNSKNNQFFVWEFPEVKGNLDNEILCKLKSRLGHYIRTELKTVFDGLSERSKYRYSINVPITEYEITLFEDNITDIEDEANEIINALCNYKEANDDSNHYFGLLKKGYLPSEFVKNRSRMNFTSIINELKKQKFLFGKADRKWSGVKKLSSYQMTKKLIDLFNEAQKELEGLKD